MSSLLYIYKRIFYKLRKKEYFINSVNLFKKNAILTFMKNKLYILPFILIFFVSSCALVTDEYQANQRKVIAYLLEDLPLPEDAQIIKAPTVLLGTGEAISGRIILTSNYSPAENLIFYGTETLSTGWQLVSSKVGEEVTLVYTKNGRFVTIYLSPKETVQGFISGDYGSDIDIAVVHPDSIGVQNPYDELEYSPPGTP